MDDKEFLEHFGILGMHWGHHKVETGSTNSSAKDLATSDKKWAKNGNIKKLASSSTQKLGNNAQYGVDAGKAYKKLVDMGLTGQHLEIAFQSAAAVITNAHLSKDPSTYNPSKTERLTMTPIMFQGSAYLTPKVVKVDAVSHSGIGDTSSYDYGLYTVSKTGSIDLLAGSINEEVTSLQQAEDLTDDFLAHHGILGMHWGIHKSEGASTKSTKTTEQSKAEKEVENRKKILASPRKLNKNLDKFSQEEINQAVTRFELNKKLQDIDIAKIKKGTDYAAAFLAVGTTAVAAYKIYQSPLGQRIAGALKKVGKSGKVMWDYQI